MKQQMIVLEEVDSTSRWLAAEADRLDSGVAVRAVRQTAGRGQRGNSWESEPGRNVTMSVLLRPEGIEAREQFALSEAVALATVEVLRRYLPEEEIAVKWPNDIYIGDRKVCGTLIENQLSGREITRSIAGIGLNVNQKVFLSDAPNPVSMAQTAGREFAVEQIAEELRHEVVKAAGEASTAEGRRAIHTRFLANLWRRAGYHPYRDTATGATFEAAIETIDPDGMLTLRLPEGILRRYAFKEVAALLPDKSAAAEQAAVEK